MRIGINIRVLSSNLTGIGRYIVSMLEAMQHSDHEFYLYAPSAITTDLPEADNIHITISNRKTKITGKIWEQFTLPGLLQQDAIDIFWSPTHHLPLALDKDIKTVLTIHDLVWKYAPETMRWLNRLSEKFLMRPSVKRADCIITISESTATDLRTIYPDSADKITVIHPAGQISELEADLTVATNIGEPFILFVGTLEPRKNLIGLLNAYRRLPSEIQDQYMLVIAGGKGWGSLDLDKNISEMGLEGRVTQTGYIPDKQLVGLYKEAQLLVMPSFYEGFGLPILEAMSVGTPVITSNISSMPEISGDAAIIVDPYDSQGIAEAITGLLKDSARHEELIAKGYERCKEFSWKSAASNLIQLFEQTAQ